MCHVLLTLTLDLFIMALKKAVEMLRGTAHSRIRLGGLGIVASVVFSVNLQSHNSIGQTFCISVASIL